MKSSVTKRMVPIIVVILAAVFLANNIMSVQMLKNEVKEQWMMDDYKLVAAYGQEMTDLGYDSTEEYQMFVDRINDTGDYNYVVYMENVDGKVVAIAHSNPDRVGIVLEDAGSIKAVNEGMTYMGYYTDQVSGKETIDLLVPVSDKNGAQKGALNIGIPADDATLSSILVTTIGKLSAVSIILAVIVIILLIVGIRLMLLAPISALAPEIQQMAQYNLTMKNRTLIERYAKRPDEIGLISTSFLNMQEKLTAMIANIHDVAEKMMGQSEELSRICTEVSDSSSQLSKTVEDVAAGATTQAQQTTEGSVQVGKLSDLIENVEENMGRLFEAAGSVETIEHQGVEVLDVLVDKTSANNENSKLVHRVMEETSGQADKIKGASEQIRGIASQTNLLALNASIEAARAGEAGRGFAVVATEIGNLAQETNLLTNEIEAVVHELLDKMKEAVENIALMEQTTVEQSESVEQTRSKFEEITSTILQMEQKCNVLADSTKEMKESRKNIIDVINDLSALSEENAACMEEASASVNLQNTSITKLATSGQEVAVLAEALNQEIEKFTIA
uniref:methyl-accepting chemotaxis protein n=1 Tax=Roseburia sp. TaxID=2049040 RepID=UPI003FEF308B